MKLLNATREAKAECDDKIQVLKTHMDAQDSEDEELNQELQIGLSSQNLGSLASLDQKRVKHACMKQVMEVLASNKGKAMAKKDL